MCMAIPSNAVRAPSPQFDRIAATLAALVVVGLAVFLLVRNQPIADPKLFFVLRVVFSFAAGLAMAWRSEPEARLPCLC